MRGCSYAAAASTTSFQKVITRPPTCAPVRVNRVSTIHGIESWNSSPYIQNGVLKSQILVSGCTGDGYRANFVSIRRNPLLLLASSESQVELETANEDENQTPSPDKDDSPTVQIKLELQRECQFGEQFLVAGDHPALGLWNPMDAAPMVWSDGHVWTAHMELPAGKMIQFKFIFRDISGEILWQPGPNRFLQAQETSNVTVIVGDWETVAVQQELMIHEEKQVIYDEDVSNNKNEKPLQESYVTSITSLNGENIEQEIPVLVPGLTPYLITPAATEQGLELNVFDNARNTIQPEQLDLNEEETEGSRLKEEEGEVQEPALIEYQNEPGFINGHVPEKGLQLILYEGQGNRNKDILYNDFKWGQETLRRFLDKLGFRFQL